MKRSRCNRRVSESQYSDVAARPDALDRIPNLGIDTGRLIHDHENVLRVATLKFYAFVLIRYRGAQPIGEPLRPHVQFRLQWGRKRV